MAKLNLSFSFATLTVGFAPLLYHFLRSDNKVDGLPEEKWNVAKVWSIESPFVSYQKLQATIDFCCGKYCGILQSGGPCFNPNTVKDHASIALDIYYKASGSSEQSCIQNSGQLLYNNPSYGSCQYP